MLQIRWMKDAIFLHFQLIVRYATEAQTTDEPDELSAYTAIISDALQAVQSYTESLADRMATVEMETHDV